MIKSRGKRVAPYALLGVLIMAPSMMNANIWHGRKGDVK